jgi:hypothetical protein
MCLDYELSEKQANKIKEQARKRGYIRVWKVCCQEGKRKRTGFVNGSPYKKGVHKAKYLKDRDGGWYSFLAKTGSKNYKDCFVEKIIVCYAKSEWIKKLGGYLGCGRAATFTHLAFPSWDKGDMTIREFKEMCKAEQKQ